MTTKKLTPIPLKTLTSYKRVRNISNKTTTYCQIYLEGIVTSCKNIFQIKTKLLFRTENIKPVNSTLQNGGVTSTSCEN